MIAGDISTRRIRAIQTCRRKVAGLEEDAPWRAFLARETSVASLRAMSLPQLNRVLEALHKAGAPRVAGRRSPYGDDPQMRMIRGLWIELARAGIVRNRAEAALSAFVRRQTGQDMGLLSAADARAVIQALKGMRARARAA